MAEDVAPSSARKVELVGKLRSEVDKLADSFARIENSSGSFARNVNSALGNFSGTNGSTTGMDASAAMSGQGAPSNFSSAGYSAAAASMSGGGSPSPILPPIVPPGGGAGSASPLGSYLSTLSDNKMANMAATFLEGSGGNISKGLGYIAAGALGMASPSLDDAVALQSIVQRQRFYGGSSVRFNPSDQMMGLAASSLPISPMDIPAAYNAALSYGITPSSPMAGQATFLGGAAAISALQPGVGVTGGVAAMGALQQGRSVNLLRMVGVNARDISSNTMNTFGGIVDQLWAILKTANNGLPPTARDISASLLPGNALDSFLNQYFGGDENLRAAVMTALFEKVNNPQGYFNANADMLASKSDPFGPVSLGNQAIGAYNAAVLGAQFKPMTYRLGTPDQRAGATINDAMVAGIVGANRAGANVVSAVPDTISLLGSLVGIPGADAYKALAFMDAYAGLGGGAGALALQGFMQAGSGLGGGLGNVLGGLLSARSPLIAKLLPRLGSSVGLFAGLGAAGLGQALGSSASDFPSNASTVAYSNGGNTTVNLNWNGNVNDGWQAATTLARRVKQTTPAARAMWT